MKTRSRLLQAGLLPRMEARPKKNGVAYRYHPVNGKPIPLGDNREVAIRKVLDLLGKSDDTGTINHCWRLYQETPEWRELAERTREDYKQSSKLLLKVFGEMYAGALTQQMCRHYMKVERQGKVRANREMAVLSNLMVVAVDHGFASGNPTAGMKRLKERPRKTLPVDNELPKFVEWLQSRGKQWAVIAAMAQFAAKTGARRTEFLRATVFQVKDQEARLGRAKQRYGAEVIDVVELDTEAQAILASVRRENCQFLFPNRSNRPYTEQGFKAMWSKAMSKAFEEKIVTVRFTFHDLRALYVSRYRAAHDDALPRLHKNPATTARVYDRRQEMRRKVV